MSVVAFLNISAQHCFRRVARICCHSLKFVNGYDARSVGIFKIMEHFIYRGLRRMDVAQLNAPRGIAERIKSYALFQRHYNVDEFLYGCSPLPSERRQHGFAENIGKLLYVFCGIYVYNDSVVFFLNARLIEKMIYQSCFADAPLSYQRDVVAIGNFFLQKLHFALSVAKQFLVLVSL